MIPTPLIFRTLFVYSVAIALVCLALCGFILECRHYMHEGRSVIGYVAWAMLGCLAIWMIAKNQPKSDGNASGLEVLPANMVTNLVAITMAIVSWILLSPLARELAIPDSLQFPFLSLLPFYLSKRIME